MLHHLSLGVIDIDASVSLYDAMLAPLGYVRVWSDLRAGEPNQAVGYGLPNGGDKLTLKHRPTSQVGTGEGFHLAFAAPDQKAVDAFYAAAILHGAKDNGRPGYRPHYGPTYYAAFVIDLDGRRLEAVCNSAI
jgi:catechol 2,3-dioxygenase-like lactoylglutathione lyase family enzyme